MKWLTTEYIKSHSRVCQNCEDSLLELYGSSAENTILNLCRRTYESFIEEYEEIPPEVIHASLELVDLSYEQRTPASDKNLAAIPYSFDLLIKPFMIL